jgi:AcrR family transcriptional regulator
VNRDVARTPELARAGGRNRRLPRVQREAQMLDAARRLFAERGYAAVTMDDVAAAVGVTKPLLYTYFGNKERLYVACMEPAGEALTRTVVEAVEGSTTYEEAVERGVRAFFAFVDADRDAWRVLFDETAPAGGEVARHIDETRQRLVGLVTAARLGALAAGQREAARTEIEAISTAVLGAAEALARWWLRTDSMTAAEVADLLITNLRQR